MDSTETKYNFYKRAFKGGGQTIQQTQPQSETIDIQPQTQTQTQVQDQQDQQEIPQPMDTNVDMDTNNLQQLNKEIPKSKINFKLSSFFGNLNQTLGSKQKINLDDVICGYFI
jgi:hypothetical protein